MARKRKRREDRKVSVLRRMADRKLVARFVRKLAQGQPAETRNA